MKFLVLLLGDVLIYFITLYFAFFVRTGQALSLDNYISKASAFAPLVLIAVFLWYTLGVYDNAMRKNVMRIFNTFLNSLVIFVIVSVFLFYLFPGYFGATPKTILVIFVLALFPMLVFWHYFAPKILRIANPTALLVTPGFVPVGFNFIERIFTREPNEALKTALENFKGKRVVIPFEIARESALSHVVENALLRGVRFIDLTAVQEEERGYVNLNSVDELWFLEHMRKARNALLLFAKRVIDIVVALFLFPIFLVFLPFVALVIKLQDGGDVFIRQKRIGLYGAPFVIYKFRSMTGSDSGKDALKSKLRVTPFGAFLRKSRIDELPQLWNILKGDLSLIGPRPEIDTLVEEYRKAIPFYHMRHIVRPGLTGWAQTTHTRDPHHGIDIEATKEKLAHDLFYIKHLSLFLELKIILKTAKLLLRKVFTRG